MNNLIKAADELARLIEEECDAGTAFESEWDADVVHALTAYRNARNEQGDLVDTVLDAANDYMKEQYGIAALGHPVDRARIRSALEE